MSILVMHPFGWLFGKIPLYICFYWGLRLPLAAPAFGRGCAKCATKAHCLTQQVAHVVVQNTRPPPRSCISVRFSPLLILLFKEPFSSLSDSRREATHSSLSWCGIRMRDLLEIATLNAQCHRASWYSICTCASCWRQPNSEFGGLLYPFFCFLKLSSLSLSLVHLIL